MTDKATAPATDRATAQVRDLTAMTPRERLNAWHLAHPEVGFEPTPIEVDLWCEAGHDVVPPETFRGGQGRSAEKIEQGGRVGLGLALVGAAAFFMTLGVLIGRAL